MSIKSIVSKLFSTNNNEGTEEVQLKSCFTELNEVFTYNVYYKNNYSLDESISNIINTENIRIKSFIVCDNVVNLMITTLNSYYLPSNINPQIPNIIYNNDNVIDDNSMSKIINRVNELSKYLIYANVFSGNVCRGDRYYLKSVIINTDYYEIPDRVRSMVKLSDNKVEIGMKSRLRFGLEHYDVRKALSNFTVREG